LEVDLLDFYVIYDLYILIHVATEVQLELKGTGNSSAKKASGGRGKAASTSGKKAAQAPKRKR